MSSWNNNHMAWILLFVHIYCSILFSAQTNTIKYIVIEQGQSGVLERSFTRESKTQIPEEYILHTELWCGM